ncbi:MAG: SCO family protein [Armatimonadaceae bacterium]
MKARNKKTIIAALLGMALLLGVETAQAQRTPPGQVGRTRTTELSINAARDVSFNQKLDAQIPLNTPFVDENGQTIALGNYFGKKPVILVMPFYKCPGVCTNELNGMVDLFKEIEDKFRVGRDFNVVTISINPNETPDLAMAKKREYLDILNQPGAEDGWHFLVGDEKNIKTVADTIGFKYAYDAKTDQYAHAAGITIITPSGKVSRYFFGVGFPPRDTKLALTEAGEGKIGTLTDHLLLRCYAYDPQQGRYGLAIWRLMQIACTATILILGTFIFLSLRSDIKKPKLVRTPEGDIVPEDSRKGRS